MGNAQKVKSSAVSKKTGFWPLIALVVVVVAAGLFINYYGQLGDATGLATAQENGASVSTGDSTTGNSSSPNVVPTQYAVRQRYFEEVFKPKRDEYNVFEKAAEYLKIPIEKVPEYFSLNSEGEIFADLPAPAKDFSEIAYLFANGSYFSIGYLEGEYYKQPEFYPYFKEIGLRYWTEPDPRYWTPNGYGSYPAEQWATLKKGETDEFTAVVFFFSGWGVQTFQGVTLMPNSEARKYFDIEITPQTFLLEPTFPKFYENWAYKIEINGKMKPETPPGTYTIGINVEYPPADLQSKWEFEHKNIYSNAAASALAPSGTQIQFNIIVE